MSDDSSAASAGKRRIETIGRHVQRVAPITTSSTSQSPPSPNPSTFTDDREKLGTFTLGPNVAIPVFQPKLPERLPSDRLLLNLDDPIALEHLEFLAKKWQLGQDVFLLSAPGPYARRLSLTFASLIQLPYEYVSFHRDVGEAELLQTRSLSAGGNLVFEDGPVIRAMKNGHLLILEGVEKAERGVTPIINNILENREQNLADGRHLIPAEKLAAFQQEEVQHKEGGASRFIPVHPNFRVIATGVPVPPYRGYPLDPPFRSRFQARWVEGSVQSTIPLPEKLSEGAQQLRSRWSQWAALLRYHTTLAQGNDVIPPTSRLPNLPTTALPLLTDIVSTFPPVTSLINLDFDESDPILPTWPKDMPVDTDKNVGTSSSTLALLSAAYPQVFALDAEKRRTLDSLLGQLQIHEQQGEGADQSTLAATGFLGYLVDSVERVSPTSAQITFVHVAGSSPSVTIEVPCGALELAPVPRLGDTTFMGQELIVTPRVLSIYSRLLQLHALGRDICLVPANKAASPDKPGAASTSDPLAAAAHQPSSSTTTCIGLMAATLGYAYESVWLWKDLGGGELLMRRATAKDGSTTWEPAPLVRGAMQGKLVHLAGVDVLGPTLGSLSRLLQDRELELWDGARMTEGDAQKDTAKPASADLLAGPTISAGEIVPIRPTFRVVATASKPTGWLDEEASTLFAICSTRAMDPDEERHIVLSRIKLSEPTSDLKRLFEFVNRYRALSADPNLGLAKSRRLGTRQVIRMASRLARWQDDCDVHGLIWRSLLVDFLPLTVREVIANLLTECGIYKPGTEGAFQYVPRLWIGDPQIVAGANGGTLQFAPSDGSDREYPVRSIPRYDADTLDPEGKTLIPDLGGSFYNNAQQSSLICSFAEDLVLLNEHLLLMGSQGTGKNKIIDRTLELLGRPREYIQMNRDSTVAGLLQQIALEGGQIRYLDSPLVRAVKLGRILVVDEADKCSTAVSAVFKSLAERGELSLPDGRRIRPARSGESVEDAGGDILVHPTFRLVLLSNRPGWPFFGNNFIEVIGEGFSCYAVANPDIESEVRLLKAAAPNVDVDLLRRLDLAFHDLRAGFESGLINHPYSLRELLHLVAHMQKYPDEPLSSVLLNTLAFDLHRPESIRWVVETLRKRNLPIEQLSLDILREQDLERIRNAEKGIKAEFHPGKEDFDPKKAGRDTNLDKPKEGKVDPKNEAHVGGNTWKGGTGGRDTMGLGGRGGYGRQYTGHKIHQISKELKNDVPDHLKKQAREMAREALEKELKENGMQPHEAVNLHEMKQKVASQVQHLSNVLNDLKANRYERAWLTRQQEGELDERRLSEGLAGERGIFKRRAEMPPDPGAPQIKPKRIRIVLDLSASMYHMQYDGRLERELEVALMVMQAFSRLEDATERFAVDIVGHSGDLDMIPLVPLGRMPKSDGDMYRILRAIVSHTQYCDSGDNTLKCIEKSIRQVKSLLPSHLPPPPEGNTINDTTSTGLNQPIVEQDPHQSPMDDYFVIVLSDANLSRYGITHQRLAQLLRLDAQVKTSLIFIDKGNEALHLAKQLPTQTHVARETKDIPRILSNILTSVVQNS
ncbi:ATPase, dynein-related, AAA domain protein [Kalmanozyma brasiliensis GHG001]|uniref:ATPase dynein-related AAA domain-containing protein n=1 Tax=Kalmanozyma brasiliensis (strain GHG001) TaxID=1365824 RepID=V5EXT4_KALBG|nr:ATPase, dynein-related, AAA domain protein [Kalmanozyma brasiliensis GHG001]EST08393.1 ATPase, dynein-related, AAA domain protein [Kalmanozyma brasiliensis GHG001]